jgi:hypothetical protein
MTAVEIKKSIHLSVESVNDTRLLEAINTMLLESLDPRIIAYEGKKPLTKADLILGALKAEEDIKQGRVYTIEEVKRQLKSSSKT